MRPESNQSSQEASTVRGFGGPSSGTSNSFQCPALRSVLAIAGVAAAASLPNPSEAAIIVSNSLFNVKVGQGGIPATSFTDFGGLVATGAAINFGTRATAGGGPSSGDYVGGVVAWGGPGSGQFLRYSQIGLNAASLVNLDQAGNGFNKAGGFANINLASVFSGTYSNAGNPAFSGVSPSTSKYLMYRFTGSGANLYYGWIEFLALTGSDGISNNYSMAIGRIAYQNTANTPLLAGEVNQPAAVPGPVPLAGAALAFGYSRRLHRRMRESEKPTIQ